MADDIEGRQYPRGSEKIIAEFQRDFLEEAEEMLHGLDVGLDDARHGRKPIPELVDDVRRVALMLRSHAAHGGVRLIGTVAHRMEDYLANARNTLRPRAIDDLQRYVDTLLEILNGHHGHNVDVADIVRALPAKFTLFDLGDIEIRNIEIMLVMLHSAQSHYIERELQQCGYRVSIITSTFEALPLVVRTKPDLVIASAMMPELSGLDFIAAITAMPATRNIPAALITSMEPEDPNLSLLPRHIPVIFKGPTFGDDLFKALDNLFLI
ncbi:MAG: Hpt domain-containing protein [Alphaproteobacteria bacterium]|nr:Hpt domain-containing protein [Alphaproteobacteria bacterium]